MLATIPSFTLEAERMLRATGSFDWSTVTLLGLAVYVYAVEIECANWCVVLAGVAFWLMDWANEIVNDMPRRSRQLQAVGTLAALDLAAGLVFGPVLGWL